MVNSTEDVQCKLPLAFFPFTFAVVLVYAHTRLHCSLFTGVAQVISDNSLSTADTAHRCFFSEEQNRPSICACVCVGASR